METVNPNHILPKDIEQLKELKFALDQAAIVVVTDAAGIIISVNDKFCKISGYSKEELLGKDHRILNSKVHDTYFFKSMWNTILAGKVWTGEICNRRKDGELYWVATTITPVIQNGKPVRFIAIRQEITELKNAQQTIQDQQEQLMTSSRLSAMGEVAASVTHEINNPLGVILGRAEMLRTLIEKNELSPDRLIKLAESIEVTGRRIERIVKSMKALSKQGTDDDPPTKVKVSELINDSLELCIERYRAHGIELKVHEPKKDLVVVTRSYQVVQVIVNLLTNAYDAILGLQDKWVKISVESNDNVVQIKVTDSGEGIPDDVVKKIFDPFFSTKRVQFGTGLGLSISKNLIMKNGGHLYYDPTQKHTTFVIELKLLV